MQQARAGASPWPGVLCLAFAVFFMAISALLYWPTPEVAFRTDDSPVAWLSSAQLWAMAVLALRLWQEAALPRGLALWLAAAMAEMAFDEQFMLHEHWKYNCASWLDACHASWVRELPMLLVGVLGLLSAAWLYRTMVSRWQRAQLGLALGIGLFALVLRATQQPLDLLPYKAALLVLAEALFMGMLLGFSATRARG
jgi:hypothetical protein